MGWNSRSIFSWCYISKHNPIERHAETVSKLPFFFLRYFFSGTEICKFTILQFSLSLSFLSSLDSIIFSCEKSIFYKHKIKENWPHDFMYRLRVVFSATDLRKNGGGAETPSRVAKMLLQQHQSELARYGLSDPPPARPTSSTDYHATHTSHTMNHRHRPLRTSIPLTHR